MEEVEESTPSGAVGLRGGDEMLRDDRHAVRQHDLLRSGELALGAKRREAELEGHGTGISQRDLLPHPR